MKLLIMLSIRNLLRQKRSFFLGGAIAFGVMVLVLVNSYARGITDLLLNKMMVNAMGHIKIGKTEAGSRFHGLIRDKKEMVTFLSNNVEGLEVIEEDIKAFTTALGNGKSSGFIIVGVTFTPEFFSAFPPLVAGTYDNFYNGTIENPILISEKHAKSLAVQALDTISVRFKTLYGQVYTARFTVGAILSAGNAMMSFAGYVDISDLKGMLGYSEHESGGLKIVLKKVKKPEQVIRLADKIHDRLKAPLMAGSVHISAGLKKYPAGIYAFNTNTINSLAASTGLTKTQLKKTVSKKNKNCLVSRELAGKLGLRPGSMLTISYTPRFGEKLFTHTLTITGIFKREDTKALVLIPEQEMAGFYYRNLPPLPGAAGTTSPIESNDPLFSSLSKEYILLDRFSTSKEFRSRMAEIMRASSAVAMLDISTMYESFEFLSQLEKAIMLVALTGMVVIFFIILIGVFNTLRMTIRERTREIGTVRAIGMQSLDIRLSFILETAFLGLFASISGSILALAAMLVLGNIDINTTSAFSMFLYEKHLTFLPSPLYMLMFTIGVVIISVVTAYFPARSAARLRAAENALRHYD